MDPDWEFFGDQLSKHLPTVTSWVMNGAAPETPSMVSLSIQVQNHF